VIDITQPFLPLFNDLEEVEYLLNVRTDLPHPATRRVASLFFIFILSIFFAQLKRLTTFVP
jgi:hypothetical protein